jgi:hypothetical protein
MTFHLSAIATRPIGKLHGQLSRETRESINRALGGLLVPV